MRNVPDILPEGRDRVALSLAEHGEPAALIPRELVQLGVFRHLGRPAGNARYHQHPQLSLAYSHGTTYPRRSHRQHSGPFN